MSKTVFITGASSGIGKATALYFQQHGWQVAATMRKTRDGADLAALPGVCVYELDVTDRGSIATAVAQALVDFKRIDVLINNAGYGLAGPFELATEAMIMRQFDTNLFGVFRTTSALLQHLRENGGGVIINVTSIGGLVTLPFNSIYHATKFGLDGYSTSLNYELNPFGIQVKVVAPGGVATDFATRSLELTAPAEDAGLYKNALEKVLARFSANVPNYSSGEQIASVIYEAATDNKPQLRYLAGEDAKALYSGYTSGGADVFFEQVKANFNQ